MKISSQVLRFALLTSAVAACPTILLGTETPVLTSGDILAKDGFVLIQQFNGALELYKGNSSNLECLMWDSPINECTSYAGGEYSFLSKLQGDANIVVNIVDESTGLKRPYWSCFGDEDCNAAIYGPGEFYDDIQMQANCDGSITVFRGEEELYTSQKGYGCTIEPAEPPCEDLLLLDQSRQVTSEFPLEIEGAFMTQRRDGSFSVYAGSLEEPGDLLWENCPVAEDQNTGKFTVLQTDGVLTTRDSGDFGVVYQSSRESIFDGPWSFYLLCSTEEGNNNYDNVAIRNNEGRTIFMDSLYTSSPPKEECEEDIPEGGQDPTCPTATILLTPGESVTQGQGFVSKGDYSIRQTNQGLFQVWRGSGDNVECVQFQTSPTRVPESVPDSYTKMQTDGNLVSYFDTGSGFLSLWSSETGQEGLTEPIPAHLVVDDCILAGTHVVVYDNDPTTTNAMPIIDASGDAAVYMLEDCTASPSAGPSEQPTNSPTVSVAPSSMPSSSPSSTPSGAPTVSSMPSTMPSSSPSSLPTISTMPSTSPSNGPSTSPSSAPSAAPSESPSSEPTVSTQPSSSPSDSPSENPTVSVAPSATPSSSPSSMPSTSPSDVPTISTEPSSSPSDNPSAAPTISTMPSSAPSSSPSSSPSTEPSSSPSNSPSTSPTISTMPSVAPSSSPSDSPSATPTVSVQPSSSPSSSPSETPTVSVAPSSTPSGTPTVSMMPSGTPTVSMMPSGTPTVSVAPSKTPSTMPSSSPSETPTEEEEEDTRAPSSKDEGGNDDRRRLHNHGTKKRVRRTRHTRPYRGLDRY